MELVLSDIDDDTHRAAVLAPLAAHNALALGRSYPQGTVAIVLRDAQGAVEGGMWADYWWEWLKLDVAFLPEHRRGRGLGSRMLATLEHVALARGCRGVWMSSFSVQAPDFYKKLGYREVGRLEGRPLPGEADVFLARDEGMGQRRATLAVTDAPDAAIRTAILARLRDFTDERLGVDRMRVIGDAAAGPTRFRTLSVLLCDEDGAILGGLWGYTGRGWLFVELLGLPQASRGGGLGTRVMEMAMAEARLRGCVGVWLDTFSFQARPFYEKLGFSVFGQIENYPTGHSRYFLARRL
jgi:ribosomal protein S18 acetylase RimI-like enzyme